eukprot:3936885-Rhodomonas_salina.1
MLCPAFSMLFERLQLGVHGVRWHVRLAFPNRMSKSAFDSVRSGLEFNGFFGSSRMWVFRSEWFVGVGGGARRWRTSGRGTC